MTKVTYNTYSCAMSGMSREMMTMDGRDSAECENWEKKDVVGINGKVYMTLKTKVNSVISYFEKGKRKTWRGR